MVNDKKPPIGVAPHWHIYQQRIEELSSAICRWVEYTKNQSSGNTREVENYDLIANWAYELMEMCKLESQLLKNDRSSK